MTLKEFKDILETIAPLDNNGMIAELYETVASMCIVGEPVIYAVNIAIVEMISTLRKIQELLDTA